MNTVYILIVLTVIFHNGIAAKVKDGRVIKIDKKDLQNVLDNHDFVLAYVIEPGHPFQALLDTNAQSLAKDLAPTRYDVVIIKCDWKDSPKFWKQYGIIESPGLLWFVKGNQEEFYNGSPDYDEFKKWVLVSMRKNSPKKTATTNKPTTEAEEVDEK